jgi:hypothetical protein
VIDDGARREDGRIALNRLRRDREMKLARSHVRVFLALSLTACGPRERPPPAEELHAELRRAVGRGTGTAVSLADIAPGSWRRVYIFGPYTPVSEIRACLGVLWARPLARGIQNRDDVNLLIFEYPGHAHRSVAVPRGAADFGPEAIGRGYSADEARFVVRDPSPDTWGDFVPVAEARIRCDTSP